MSLYCDELQSYVNNNNKLSVKSTSASRILNVDITVAYCYYSRITLIRHNSQYIYNPHLSKLLTIDFTFVTIIVTIGFLNFSIYSYNTFSTKVLYILINVRIRICDMLAHSI